MRVCRFEVSLVIFLFALSLALLPYDLASKRGDGEKLAPKEKQNGYGARPGKVIYIGIIPPEILEAPLDGQKEVAQEEKQEYRLSWEEIARLRQRLKELEKERQTLSGDFYGINQYGYRYALVFDRLGYIRFQLHQVESEMAEIRKKLSADF